MRLMFALVLMIGLGLAGFAVYMAQDRFTEYQVALERQQQALRNNVPLSQVFVVNRQVRYGERLTKEDVRLQAWPSNAIPEGAFLADSNLFPKNSNEVRSVLRTMEKHEPVLKVKVTEPGADAGVTSRLAPGMRAFAIRVDVATGVSGFLRPGDNVDIYWSGRTGGGDVTRLILDKVRLIAIDQIADEDRNQPTVARTVTVEVSPKAVGTLAQAQSTGRLYLSLRGVEDNNATGQVEIDQQELLGIEEQIVKKEPTTKTCSIRTRRGTEVVDIEIPCPDGDGPDGS